MADNPNFAAMTADERIEAGKRAQAALESERENSSSGVFYRIVPDYAPEGDKADVEVHGA